MDSSHQQKFFPRHQFILDSLQTRAPITNPEISAQEIFHCIYARLQNLNHPLAINYHGQMLTIVIVAGVFNEYFQEAPFVKGVRYLCAKYGFRYLVLKVGGTHDSLYNAKLIKQQMFMDAEQNPHDRYWVIGFSKGGPDFLHFLQQNSPFAQEKIFGFSAIASPLLGSAHFTLKRVQLANKLYQFPHKLYPKSSLFNLQSGLLAPAFQQSLHASFRQDWLSKNYHHLPATLFYTSLAFAAPWYRTNPLLVLTKALLPHREANDGIVDVRRAHFPKFIPNSFQLGNYLGDHLSGSELSSYRQEALLEAHLFFLDFYGKFDETVKKT